MAFDSARHTTVVHAGFNSNITFNYSDTWEWNGTVWTDTKATGPSARDNHAIAFDSLRAQTVLFGGYSGVGDFGDTWEWSGAAWSNRIEAGPAARSSPSMAFDSSRGRALLFGGVHYVLFGGPTYFDDTWEWDGAGWIQRAVSGPVGRYGQAIAYDSARRVSVMFGGYTSTGVNGETWELGSLAECRADLNHDGQVDDADFSIFVIAYNILACAEAGMPPGCPADLNGDGLVEDADFSIFVVAYDALLCP